MAGLSLGALLRGEGDDLPPAGDGEGGGDPGLWMVGLGCTLCVRKEGRPSLSDPVADAFLRLLEVPDPRRGGRRTRYGRTPFIAQQKLAAWCGTL